MFCTESILIRTFSRLHTADGIYHILYCDCVRGAITRGSMTLRKFSVFLRKTFVQVFNPVSVVWLSIALKAFSECICNRLLRGAAVHDWCKVAGTFIVKCSPRFPEISRVTSYHLRMKAIPRRLFWSLLSCFNCASVGGFHSHALSMGWTMTRSPLRNPQVLNFDGLAFQIRKFGRPPIFFSAFSVAWEYSVSLS